ARWVALICARNVFSGTLVCCDTAISTSFLSASVLARPFRDEIAWFKLASSLAGAAVMPQSKQMTSRETNFFMGWIIPFPERCENQKHERLAHRNLFPESSQATNLTRHHHAGDFKECSANRVWPKQKAKCSRSLMGTL